MYIKSPDMVWNMLDSKQGLQYFFLGKQPYHIIWKLQKKLHLERVKGKISNIILLLEHEHVYTFGKNADKNYLLDSKPKDAEIVQIDRGGEVTYHGPGQLVVYPIIDLHDYKLSVSWYMRTLEEIVIYTLNKIGLTGMRKDNLTGVWIDDEKICAMGVRLSRWVTMHGLALNLNPNMQYFDSIIPCGIFNYGVTSIYNLEKKVTMDRLIRYITDAFQIYFKK